jgi:adenine-specific DNA-methyltransferase
MSETNTKLEIEKLKTENERLKKELKKNKKYGLVWEDKPEEVVEMCKMKLPILKEVKSKEIITDPTKPMNLLIEGDNYHALSVLNYAHAKKIDVIYIDPPYNTGNKDFIYNDCYVDREDAFRHSKWLSFMEKRLKLAKNLLKDTGVICISIDDNEIAQLKMLMNNSDLFGEDNFIASFIWNKKNVVQNDARFVSVNHEYVLCYAKDVDKLSFNLLPRTDELNARYNNPDDDIRGPWTSVALQAKSGSPSNIYEITFPNGIKWKPVGGTFPRLNRESLMKAYNEGRLWFGLSGKNVPRLKKYLNEVKQGVISNSILFPEDVGSTQLAKETIKKILDENNFDTPKPVELIKRFVRLNSDKEGAVLDFMAGSGTTGHAVLELNKEDNGNRKFILCTNNEDNNGNGHKIAEDICYPRIKKVIEGYKNQKNEKIVGLGGNLKYFRTDFINYDKPTDRNKIELTEKATEMLCVKENTFEPTVDNKRFKIFKGLDHHTGVIWDQNAIPDFKKKIKGIDSKISVYIFSLGDETFDDEFEDIKNKVKLSPIPEAILKVYRRIFK